MQYSLPSKNILSFFVLSQKRTSGGFKLTYHESSCEILLQNFYKPTRTEFLGHVSTFSNIKGTLVNTYIILYMRVNFEIAFSVEYSRTVLFSNGILTDKTENSIIACDIRCSMSRKNLLRL